MQQVGEVTGQVLPLPVVASADEWASYARQWVGLQDRLFRVGLLIAGGDRALAEDAVSDALLATFRPWSDGRVDDVYQYARRALANRLVGGARRHAVAERFRARRSGDGRGALDPGDVATDRATLAAALAALPARQRAVVALRFYEALSVSETAAQLGVDEGTVKSQTSKAMAFLRARLGEDPAREINDAAG